MIVFVFYSEAAGPEEGDEASFPTEQFPVVATCNCETVSNIYAADEDLTGKIISMSLLYNQVQQAYQIKNYQFLSQYIIEDKLFI